MSGFGIGDRSGSRGALSCQPARSWGGCGLFDAPGVAPDPPYSLSILTCSLLLCFCIDFSS